MIPPHGERLVDQVVAKEDAPAAREEAASLPGLVIGRDAAELLPQEGITA